jgi:heme oxygenase
MSLGLPRSQAEYVNCLGRIYGFEAPIESSFAMTEGLSAIVDLRSRRRTRLLRADLCSLGANPDELAAMSSPTQFSTYGALGWMYVVDRSALLHRALQRHVALLPGDLARATSYLTNGGRGVGARLEDLDLVLAEVIQTPERADQVIEGARQAFAAERSWFDHGCSGTDTPRVT